MSYHVFIPWHWASYWISGFLIFKMGQEHLFPRDIIRMKWSDIWRFTFELLVFSLLLLFLLLNLQICIHKSYTEHSIICLKETCSIQNNNLKKSKVLASYFLTSLSFFSHRCDLQNLSQLCLPCMFLFWFCCSLSICLPQALSFLNKMCFVNAQC